jgi:cytochrome P450
VTLDGAEIEAGEKVALYFASANFDESVSHDPHVLDLERSPNDHVSFGRSGPHFCLGAHLARLEVRVVLEELASRVSSIELTDEPVNFAPITSSGSNTCPFACVPPEDRQI